MATKSINPASSQDVQSLWAELNNVPVSDDGFIDEAFRGFPKGTDLHDIWHWIEKTFDVSVHDLMFNRVSPQVKVAAIDHETFQTEAEKHLEALRTMIEDMPFRGNSCEESQKVCLMQALSGLEAYVSGVQPFDFVKAGDLDLVCGGRLELVDSAEQTFNDHPDFKLFRVQVWFDDGDEDSEILEDHECLVCAASKQDVEAMRASLGGMLGVDSDLVATIGNLEQVYPPE